MNKTNTDGSLSIKAKFEHGIFTLLNAQRLLCLDTIGIRQ